MSEGLFDQYKAALRRGHMAALAGELDEALAAYDAAGRLVPERALPLASRGTVLHRLDRWPEAAEAFDRALELAPDDEASLRARATARAERGLRSGAAADYERLAFVLDVAGRAPLAADAARRAADLEPTDAREALAARLGTAAAQVADLAPPAAPDGIAPTLEAVAAEPLAGDEAAASLDNEAQPEDPWSAALDPGRLEALDTDDAALGGRTDEDEAAANAPADAAPVADSGVYDALDALRAGMDAEEEPEDAPDADGDDSGLAGRVEAPAAEATEATEATADAPEATAGDGGEEGGSWPGIDLPSPPPPPLEGRLEPEELLAEAALVLESGEIDAARDLMLTAARVHRDAGRTDAALEICLNLLSIAPGDPRVHLAIANLQLDRGWTGVATEKIDLLVRLTSLTGDTQAEADVHGLASERLRDDPAPAPAGR